MGNDVDGLRILGIDPGSRITGYGVITQSKKNLYYVACGIIKASPKLPFPERIMVMHNGICEVIEKHRPVCAAVEDVFFAKNPKSALKLGQARGAIIAAVMREKLTVAEYTPKRIKQTVVGYGQAGKEQVQHMVKVLLKLSASPSEDAADALAAAICYANHMTIDTL